MQTLNSRNYYLWFVALLWAMNPILHDIVVVIEKIPVLGWFSSQIVIVIMVLLGLLSARQWKDRIRMQDVGLYLAFCMIFFIEYVCFTNNEKILNEIAPVFLIQSAPFLLFGLIIDLNKVESALYKISAVSLVVQMFYFWFFLRRYGYLTDNLMGDLIVSAYTTLPHVLVVLWQTLKKPKFINIVLSVLGVVLMLSFSNRGSMVAMAFFVLMYLIFVGSGNVKYKIGIGAVLVLFLVFFDAIIQSLYSFTFNMGMSVSMFDRYFEGTIGDSNGRDDIVSQIWPHIGDSFFGLGLGSDRLLAGTYSHNMVVEVLISFGIFIGGCLLIALFWLIIKSFIKTTSKEVKAFMLVLFSSSVMKLMFSSSFLVEPHLYMLIGFCVAALRQSRYKPQTLHQ